MNQHPVPQIEIDAAIPPIVRIGGIAEEEAELARILPLLTLGDQQPDEAVVLDFKKHSLRHHFDELEADRRHLFTWPSGLYIPAGADASGWPYFVGVPQRFARSWTNGLGWSHADHLDGSLLGAMSSPTVKGAISGVAEAGLGVVHAANDTLTRIRMLPELRFTGRFTWNVTPPPTVWTSVRATASVYVGGFELDPVTGQWGAIPTSPWRRHLVFDRQQFGSGAFATELVPFSRENSSESGQVLVEGGRTYLLSVVAQVELQISTTDSAGRPVTVTDGRFDTTASLTGLVPEIWLDKTVLIA